MHLITNALAGALIGLEGMLKGTWRLSYRPSTLCCRDRRSGAPCVMAEPKAQGLL